MRHPASVQATRLVRAAVAVALLAGLVTTPALAVEAPAGLTIEARVLVDGHVRVGSWMAIDIHVANTGPAISGELRLAGGAQGRTRFGTRVDLPTQSDKTYRLYAQPPGFGRDLEISLVDGDRTVATTDASFTVHDASQLVVGIVAEQPGDIVGDLDLLPNQNSVAPLTVALTVADLPVRVEAWGVLDRLVWQDTDSATLTTEQIEALRGWVAGGGRLVIVGGTAGPASLSAFPDALLPYRPTATTDVEPASLVTLLGEVPDTATALPALTGELTEGRALATAGDRTVAAERAYGSGSVTIVGFDPTASWIGGTTTAEGMWRRLLPTRASGGPILGDDSQIVSAASQLPSLALPPIGGLIGLLGAYILLIGPINYLVLRRLDRREWAWITMPVLIVAFAAGAYGFGSFLRGSDLIVNEVAIVRGSPGATEGTAQIYLGVFSPSRGTYQLRVPGGALLSSPTNGNFEGNGTAATLDVLQGDPAQVRDLGVGFGSLRTVRAETAVDVPLVQAQLRLEDGRLKGTVINASDEVLLKPAVVLGGTVARLSDLAPGASESFDVALQAVQIGQSLSERIVGPMTFGDSGQALGEGAARINARHTMLNQMTFDPNMGFSGQLPSDGPVILAWADHTLLPVEIEGAEPRREANVLWFLPTEVSISGRTVFRHDLLRSTVISSDANFFSKEPSTISLGRGTVELAYRPIAFEGTIEASELAIGVNFGEPGFTVDPKPIEPLPSIPPACEQGEDGCLVPGFEGIPEVEFYDLTAAAWKRLPHLEAGSRYSIAEPARYVDPATGTVRIRLVSENDDGIGFSLDLSITGDVK